MHCSHCDTLLRYKFCTNQLPQVRPSSLTSLSLCMTCKHCPVWSLPSLPLLAPFRSPHYSSLLRYSRADSDEDLSWIYGERPVTFTLLSPPLYLSVLLPWDHVSTRITGVSHTGHPHFCFTNFHRVKCIFTVGLTVNLSSCHHFSCSPDTGRYLHRYLMGSFNSVHVLVCVWTDAFWITSVCAHRRLLASPLNEQTWLSHSDAAEKERRKTKSKIDALHQRVYVCNLWWNFFSSSFCLSFPPRWPSQSVA